MQKIKEYFSDNTRKMTKNDWVILGIITLIYSIISFINLGSFKNPQTFVEFREDNGVTLEIEGDAKYVSKMRIYTGEETRNICIDGING